MLVNDDRAFKRSLDEQTTAQQKLHLEALDRALAKHDEVRTSAERARERVELELERERRRREEEEVKAIEKARRELEEQKLAEQRRQLEEAKVREEERKRREALNREQEEVRRNTEAQKQREADETRRRSEARKEQEAEQLRKSTEESARIEEARRSSELRDREQQRMPNGSQTSMQQTVAATVQPNGISPISRPFVRSPATSTQALQMPTNLPRGLVSSSEEREALHNRYLDLHKRLKQMREQVSNEVKKVSGLKNQLSDWRRAIQKCVGQLGKGSSDDIKASNKRAVRASNHTTMVSINMLTLFHRCKKLSKYWIQRLVSPSPASMSRSISSRTINLLARAIKDQPCWYFF